MCNRAQARCCGAIVAPRRAAIPPPPPPFFQQEMDQRNIDEHCGCWWLRSGVLVGGIIASVSSRLFVAFATICPCCFGSVPSPSAIVASVQDPLFFAEKDKRWTCRRTWRLRVKKARMERGGAWCLGGGLCCNESTEQHDKHDHEHRCTQATHAPKTKTANPRHWVCSTCIFGVCFQHDRRNLHVALLQLLLCQHHLRKLSAVLGRVLWYG